jgi:hypothetical protein
MIHVLKRNIFLPFSSIQSKRKLKQKNKKQSNEALITIHLQKKLNNSVFSGKLKTSQNFNKCFK